MFKKQAIAEKKAAKAGKMIKMKPKPKDKKHSKKKAGKDKSGKKKPKDSKAGAKGDKGKGKGDKGKGKGDKGKGGGKKKSEGKNKSKNANLHTINDNASHEREEQHLEADANECVSNVIGDSEGESAIIAKESAPELVPISQIRGRRHSHMKIRSSRKRVRSSEQHLRWQDERKGTPLCQEDNFGAQGDSDIKHVSRHHLHSMKDTTCKHENNIENSTSLAPSDMSSGDHQHQSSELKKANITPKVQRTASHRPHSTKSRKRVRHMLSVDYMLNENKDARNLKYYDLHMQDNKHGVATFDAKLSSNSSSVEQLTKTTIISFSDRPSPVIPIGTSCLGLNKHTFRMSSKTFREIENPKCMLEEDIHTVTAQQEEINSAPNTEMIKDQWNMCAIETFNSESENQTECCMFVHVDNYTDSNLVSNEMMCSITQQTGEALSLYQNCEGSSKDTRMKSIYQENAVLPSDENNITDQIMTVSTDVFNENCPVISCEPLAESSKVYMKLKDKKLLTALINSKIVKRMKCLVTNIIDYNASSALDIRKAGKSNLNENYKIHRLGISQPHSDISSESNRGNESIDDDSSDSDTEKPTKGKSKKVQATKAKLKKGNLNKGKGSQRKSRKGKSEKVKFSKTNKRDKSGATSDRNKFQQSLEMAQRAGKRKLSRTQGPKNFALSEVLRTISEGKVNAAKKRSS